MSIRIDKYLANLGICSRRKVQDFLNQNNANVDGKRIKEAGQRIDPSVSKLTIQGKTIKSPELEYHAVYKPKGYVTTTTDEHNRRVVTQLVKSKQRLYPVGRLDIDSEGLVLLTNDGELTNLLTHPRFHIPKTYEVTLAGTVKSKYLKMLRQGIMLKDGKTQPTQTEVLEGDALNQRTILEITLYEGRNRQIRRMCKATNLELINLKRIAMGELLLGDLHRGESRPLSEIEINQLKALS